jgi:predicted Na+-dependent transporter
MALTAIYTTQLIFDILNILVSIRLSLVDPGEPLRLVTLVPTALIVSLIFLPLLGLISACVFEGHQLPPT